MLNFILNRQFRLAWSNFPKKSRANLFYCKYPRFPKSLRKHKTHFHLLKLILENNAKVITTRFEYLCESKRHRDNY